MVEHATAVPGATRLCPLCGGAASGTFSARYRLAAKCGNPACGHLYAAQAAVQQGVQLHADPAAECRRYAERDKRLVGFLSARGVLRDDTTVLDFGSGSGHVAMAVRARFPGLHLLCVEADAGARSWLVGQGLHVLGGLDEVPPVLDAVLLIEVIEHLDDPIGFLRHVAARLTPAGRVFITTPCGETRSGSRATTAYDTPEHIHFFTEQSLRFALNQAAMGPVDFLPPVSALYPRPSGPAALVSIARDAARTLRAVFEGPRHLVTIAGRLQ